MKGKHIKKIPNNDTVIPLHGDIPLHLVHLSSAIRCLTLTGCSQAKFPTRTSGVTLRLITLSWGFGLTHWHISYPWQQASQA
eukprot:5372934-Ditylum_brightwellii.AAC.1